MRLPVLALFALPLFAQGTLDFLNHNRSMLDAHNCYPYQTRYADRIDRALSTGFPVGIEQDLAWHVDSNGKGHIVVSHSKDVTAEQPELRTYFFEKVRPIVEKALKDNNRASWPIIVLHFDFKTVTPPLLHAVWDILGEYEGWISTATKSADPSVLTPFDPKPLLVLTEDSDEQEEVFYKALPVGSRMRIFGSAHTRTVPGQPKEEHDRLLATLTPDQLLTKPATTYRRWWNNSWFAVEEGGQKKAGDWTAADDKRLHALVDHAHKLGYWIRFYTLDGFSNGDSQGWDQNYNFGTTAEAEKRWKAAIAAGVNLIATDQYETVGPIVRGANQAVGDRR